MTQSEREYLAADWRAWSYAEFGRMPPAWREALDADPHLRSARVVIDLVFARSRRVTVMGGLTRTEWQARSAEPFHITSLRNPAEGVQVWPALLDEPPLRDDVQLSNTGVSAGARSIQVSLWGELVDPKGIIQAGWPLYGEAEISLMTPGMPWEQRLVYLRGKVTASSNGPNEELVRVTVSDPFFQVEAIPPWVLDTTRWPFLNDASVGERTPIVVNGATRVPLWKVSASAPNATNSYLVAEGHQVSIDAIYAAGQLAGATNYDVSQQLDGAGLPVTVIDFLPASGAPVWTGDRASIYAQVTETGSTTTGLIQAVRQLMQRYGQGPRKRLALRLFGEAEARVGQVGGTVGGRLSPLIVVNEQTTVERYVGDVLFNDYPMAVLAWEDEGLGPVVVDSRAIPVAQITCGTFPCHDRPPGVQYEWDPVGNLRNSFVLRYDFDAMDNIYRKVTERNPTNNALCQWSEQFVGVSPAQEMRSTTITDASTANYVLDWWVEHAARPSCTVRLRFFPEAWFTLRRGDPIEFTDLSVGFNAERAIVLGRSWTKGVVEFVFRIFPRQLDLTGAERSY